MTQSSNRLRFLPREHFNLVQLLDKYEMYCDEETVFDKTRPNIPHSVAPKVKLLIENCLKYEPNERPSFEIDMVRLEKMRFQITSGVNSRKVRQFATAMKDRERELQIDSWNRH
jgi:hypothetical protein